MSTYTTLKLKGVWSKEQILDFNKSLITNVFGLGEKNIDKDALYIETDGVILDGKCFVSETRESIDTVAGDFPLRPFQFILLSHGADYDNRDDDYDAASFFLEHFAFISEDSHEFWQELDGCLVKDVGRNAVERTAASLEIIPFVVRGE